MKLNFAILLRIYDPFQGGGSWVFSSGVGVLPIYTYVLKYFNVEIPRKKQAADPLLTTAPPLVYFFKEPKRHINHSVN